MFGKKQRHTLKRRVSEIETRAPSAAQSGRSRASPRAILPRADRHSSFANCTVYYAGVSSLPGVIIDHSETGVRVRFRHRQALPERVRLVCPQLAIDRLARVVRRLDFDVGLRFID